LTAQVNGSNSTKLVDPPEKCSSLGQPFFINGQPFGRLSLKVLNLQEKGFGTRDPMAAVRNE